MKVILKSDVEKLGRAGDIKNVRLGFARNYLLVRGLAMEATPVAVREYEKSRERREKARTQTLESAKATCEKLAAVKLTFDRKVAEGGRLFGSVGKTDIVKGLKSSGYTVEKGDILLDAAIKELGELEVEVRLAPEASAKIKVAVVART
ncbi:MAG: 50S ribosomal protein L9 [Elusimicrobiota bacterium]